MIRLLFSIEMKKKLFRFERVSFSQKIIDMKELIFSTNNDWAGLITRLTIGIVLFAHGSQKMLGWFGGGGFKRAMNYFTSNQHLPAIVGFLVICIEFFGSLCMIAGFASRLWAIAIIFLFLGIIFTASGRHGFFMNWYGTKQGEGYEFHLLMIGLAIATLIGGSGKYSIDILLFN